MRDSGRQLYSDLESWLSFVAGMIRDNEELSIDVQVYLFLLRRIGQE